jgi:SpoVK/Ycf46/Vps4 family AAA+-type ATPase
MPKRNPVVLRSKPLAPDEDRVNREFLDLHVQRVELLLEVFILRRLLREGQVEAEAASQREQDLNTVVRMVDQQLLEMVSKQKKGEPQFPLLELFDLYDLDQAEREIFVFALAPRLDLSVRKRYARFHDNVLLDFPDIQFLTVLVSGSRIDSFSARRLFDDEAPLIKNKLVELHAPADISPDSYLGWEVRPPARLVDYVLGYFGLERELRKYCVLEKPEVGLDEVVLAENTADEVLSLVDRFGEFTQRVQAHAEKGKTDLGGAMVIQFSGPSGTGKTLFTRAVASRMGQPLIRVNCSKLNLDGIQLERLLDNLFFEASLKDAVLCFEAAEAFFGSKSARLPTLYEQFVNHDGLVILNATDPTLLDGSLERWVVYQVDFNPPEATERQKIWELHLPKDMKIAKDVEIDILASQYDLTGFQIRNALVVASNRALAENPKKPVLSTALLERAAYAQLRASMDEFTTKSKVSLALDDLVLPEKQLIQIKEILNAARVRPFVMNRWGFGKRMPTGKGIVSLFTGEPGTGKTLCAEILANELEMNLYQVSIPRVMSKYIGETEKNMEKIFATARANNSMLLFDEADALFTSRVKVESSVDRFSNMEVNNLLQEIERFEGVIILTTNLDKNIDKAFQRRINFRISFPFPEKKYRAIIWEKLIPKECPLADEVDFNVLGEYFELSGGYIKNAVVRAAYRAYGDDRSICYEDFLFAAERECESAGRIFRRPEDFD